MSATDEPGVCPKCKQTMLIYKDAERSDDNLFYPWRCANCKAKGKEWYSLSFIEHEIEEK